MSGAGLAIAGSGVREGTAFGFFGKIPARGDFVRAGLPRSFIETWDAWLQGVIAGSREILGETWLPAWMEAPIWRFALGPGIAGPDAVLGLWIPSVDRAGRHFPLTLAYVAAGSVWALHRAAAGWLDAAERIGLAALEEDTPPDIMAEALRTVETGEAPDLEPIQEAPTQWWTAGGPFVAAQRMALPRLPDAPEFAKMLSDAAGQGG